MTVTLKPEKYKKASEAIGQLDIRNDPQTIFSALRFLKNSVIGNPTRKSAYLSHFGIAERLVSLATEYSSDPVLMSELAPVVGSLAQYDVEKLLSAGVMLPLLSSLSSTDSRVVSASARALRQIVQHPLALKVDLNEKHVFNLLELARSKKGVSETAVSILARVAEKPRDRELLVRAGVISVLVEWLDDKWSSQVRVQENVLDALASLCKAGGEIGVSIASHITNDGKTILEVLFAMLRDKRSPMRLGACSCLSLLYIGKALDEKYINLVATELLPAIIRLFEDNTLLGISMTTVQEKSLSLFAILIRDHLNLQNSALEADAISKISRILLESEPYLPANEVSPNSEKIKENALLALSSATYLTEDARRQVIELKLLPLIVEFLGSDSVALRIASCRCLRSLSRSVKSLRTSLMDAGVAQPLFNLVFDNDLDVQINSTATLCNIVLDFSPMKRIVIERGGVERLVALVQSSNHELRLNAAWALKNMLYHTDLDMKRGIMTHLGWPQLTNILNDPQIEIQIQALNLFRNLACAKTQDIDFVFDGFGAQAIMNMIEEKFNNYSNNHNQHVLIHVLYIIVNIGIGSPFHKNTIMSRFQILENIKNCLTHSNPQIRVAAIWSIINLTWPDDPGSKERSLKLRSLGFETSLQIISNDDEYLDSRDRAKTALDNIQNAIESSELN